MAFSDWSLARTYPETDPGALSSHLRSYIFKAEHDQSVTKNLIRKFPEPGPNRIRNMGRDQLLYHRKTAKPEILEAREFPLLEIGPEGRGLRRHGSWDAVPETATEAADLEPRNGELGPVYTQIPRGGAWIHGKLGI